ncbi:transposase [Microvirga makkahensis]|uniref:transposase n=1 Tax=Microvirga makkahensis TaxID=1128670 RepID=UPI003CCDC285
MDERSGSARRAPAGADLSGIVYVIRNGLQSKDAPKRYGSHKTLHSRFMRWSRLGCSIGSSRRPRAADATPLKVRRTVASLRGKEMFPVIPAARKAAELQSQRRLR